MKSKINSKPNGFTLIELLIVIAIIGLLATVVLIALSNARIKSRDVKRLADVKQMMSALELYFSAKGSYPTQVTQQAIVPGVVTGIGLLVPTYTTGLQAAPVPNDGSCSTANNTYYYSSANGADYNIKFCLGNKVGIYTAGLHTASSGGITP